MNKSVMIGILCILFSFLGFLLAFYCLHKKWIASHDYEADAEIAIILRRFETGYSDWNTSKVVLDGMETDERTRVLESVLNCKPYSNELGAQLKITAWNKNEEEVEQLHTNPTIQEHQGHDNSKDAEKGNGNRREWLSSSDKKNDHPHYVKEEEDPEGLVTASNNKQQHQDGEEMSILDRIWKELGQKKNKKKKRAVDKAIVINETTSGDPVNTIATDEVTETCAICMEDYEENQDVIIGHNCFHMYHKECLLLWMTAKHDSCPYCRTNVFDVPTFRQKAEEVLGARRYCELVEQDDPEVPVGVVGSISRGYSSSSSTGDDDQLSS